MRIKIYTDRLPSNFKPTTESFGERCTRISFKINGYWNKIKSILNAVWLGIKRIFINSLYIIFGTLILALIFALILVVFDNNVEIQVALGDIKKQENIKLIGWGISGLVAIIVAISLMRRSNALDKQNELAEKGHTQERFKVAIEHLGNADNPTVRIASFYELYRLARDNKDFDKELLKNIFDILCAHLRNTTRNTDYQENQAKDLPTEEIQSLLDILFNKDETIFEGMSANLQRSYFVGVNLKNSHLEFANLIDTVMEKSDLKNANLEQAILEKAKLKGAKLGNANLKGANLQDSDLSESFCNATILENANMQRAQLYKAYFGDAVLKNANLMRASLSNTNLEYAHLTGADLRYITSEYTNLYNADLENALLQHTGLWHANFSDANLKNANLNSVALIDSDLQDARLQGATISSSRLKNVKLQYANLEGATLYRTILEGSHLEHAKMPIGWEKVVRTMPDGTENNNEDIAKAIPQYRKDNNIS